MDINIEGASAEEIFANMVQRGNGGTRVITMSAPALSTQFVKSMDVRKAQPGEEGCLAMITFPSWEDMIEKFYDKHEKENICGYSTTLASNSYPAGYGERSARALQREENTYQLKGKFPSAALAVSKLKARVEARQGDVSAIDRIFAKMWGLSYEEVTMLPNLHVSGSEATRMSAMEDRAYHALSGHPGHHGGYRVDMATLAPDALGEDIPLNWPRIRTALKAIALMQLQGDLEVASSLKAFRSTREFKFGMDLFYGAQTHYSRPYPWEKVLDRLISADGLLTPDLPTTSTDIKMAIASTFESSYFETLCTRDDLQISSEIQSIASTVYEESNKTLRQTIDVIHAHDRERAMLDSYREDDFEDLEDSELSRTIEVPRYKVKTTSLKKGLRKENLGKDNLPDVASHGKQKLKLDLAEFREAKLAMPIDVAGALNIAIYIIVMQPATQLAAYELMEMVKVDKTLPGGTRPVAEILRNPKYYRDKRVRSLGKYLFADAFVSTFDILLHNMSSQEYRDDVYVKHELWRYLSNRCEKRRPCPVIGSWRDLIPELITCEEGWSLYYWVRITVGKRHHSSSTSILAPIVAGDQVDLLTLIRDGVKERAKMWKTKYTAQYKNIENSIADRKEKFEKLKAESLNADIDGKAVIGKYVPPHLRKADELGDYYNVELYLNRRAKYKEEEYKLMVEYQSKAKFFSMIQVYTSDRRLTIGVPEDEMLNMWIEFYQARWFSLEKRLEKIKKKDPKKPLKLGPWEFHTHPWGKLETELPCLAYDMLMFMCKLDLRAWTVNPGIMYDKFKKSIGELWNDVINEMHQVVDYIREVQTTLAAEQDLVGDDDSNISVKVAMSNLEPIPVPSFGYRAPYNLPTRKINVMTKNKYHETPVETSGSTFVDSTITPEKEEIAGQQSLSNFDDDDMFDLSSFKMANMSTVLDTRILQAEYVTYRHLWHILGLPETSDVNMRLAYGVSGTKDLDDQHVDNTIGPAILRGEESQAPTLWAHKMTMILKRLKQFNPEDLDDDM